MNQLRIFAAIAITLVLFTARGYSATCSTATLKGSYAYQDTQEDPDGTKWYIVGYLKFDGAGNGSTNWIFHNSNGAIDNNQVGGPITYTVNQNCSFSFTSGSGLTFSGVIGNNTNELNYVETTGWQFRRGSASKVTRPN